MTALKLTGFQGLSPRTAERLLNDYAAQVAENVNLTSGEIRPIKYPELVYTAPNAQTAYRAVSSTGETWRTWTKDVDVAKGPLPADVEARYYWTGDGEPRYATLTNFGVTDWALGIPSPKTAAGVSHSGGTGAVESRIYTYTFVTALGEESGPAPASTLATGKVDGTWALTSMDTTPSNSGTFTGVYATGVTTCTASGNHYLRTGDEVVINSETYTVTVTSNTVFKVTGNVSAHTAWARKANWNTSGLKQRIYRTAGTTGSYQMVVEQTPTATYNDTIATASIPGDELITDGWEPPPAGLRGLCVLPSGAMAGFVNNLLCFSEPYQPHAFPTAYQLATDYQIVATASFGTVVVAATASRPYMADGVEPASATLQDVNVIWPCLSKRSMCSVGDGVVYATSSGLAYIGAQGPSVFTKDYYTEVEWKLLTPSSMITELSEGRLFIRYQPTGESQAMLLFKMGELATLTTSSVQAEALYTDPTDGELYILDSNGVKRFDSDAGYRMPWTWTSKEVTVPTPLNLGACRIDMKLDMSPAESAIAEAARLADLAANQVVLNAYDGEGGINRHMINGWGINQGPTLLDVGTDGREHATFNLYADDELITSKTVYTSETFKLPAGYLTDSFEVQMSGTARVSSVKLAETVDGLRTV
jgi:hypothetical protein